MPLIMWDNKTKRAPVIQTVAIERMCHQIAVGCVLTETRLNSTEWPNGPQATNNDNGDDDGDVGSGGGSSALPVELPRHTTAAAAVAAAAVGNEQQEEAAKTESRNNKMNERN